MDARGRSATHTRARTPWHAARNASKLTVSRWTKVSWERSGMGAPLFTTKPLVPIDHLSCPPNVFVAAVVGTSTGFISARRSCAQQQRSVLLRERSQGTRACGCARCCAHVVAVAPFGAENAAVRACCAGDQHQGLFLCHFG